MRLLSPKSLDEWESTNAPLLTIDTELGFFGIDTLGDTWVEAQSVFPLWKGRGKIPTLRSSRPGAEIWFVSLDWLIGVHPKETWLRSGAETLRKLVEEKGFEE
jgi:hypothetical protein